MARKWTRASWAGARAHGSDELSSTNWHCGMYSIDDESWTSAASEVARSLASGDVYSLSQCCCAARTVRAGHRRGPWLSGVRRPRLRGGTDLTKELGSRPRCGGVQTGCLPECATSQGNEAGSGRLYMHDPFRGGVHELYHSWRSACTCRICRNNTIPIHTAFTRRVVNHILDETGFLWLYSKQYAHTYNTQQNIRRRCPPRSATT